MASDDSFKVLMYSIFGFFGGAFLFYKGFGWYREKRLIQNTPTSKIRSLAMGLVETKGNAFLPKGKVMYSPFSKTKCIYYRYTIEELRRSGKSSHWATIKSGDDRQYFYLRDNTGNVLVDPKGAHIDIPVDHEFKSSFGKNPPDNVREFLESKSLNSRGLLGLNKTMRYREYYITEKDPIYIMGAAGDNPFVEDGSSQRNENDIMIHKGKSFYYISDKSEKELLKKYNWKVIGGLFGGAALMCGCLFYIFAFFGIL